MHTLSIFPAQSIIIKPTNLGLFYRNISVRKRFIMNSQNKRNLSDHLTVTSDQFRDKDVHTMNVKKIADISPSVKHVILQTQKRPVPFTFKAGQWIDMLIPGIPQVGGFSITSSPSLLLKTGEFHLAVKYSDSPPSKWIHTSCKEGVSVGVRVGGDFLLDLQQIEDATTDNHCILLIAGGVGINPLASIIHELNDKGFKIGSKHKDVKTSLMLSAKTWDELIFHDKFKLITSVNFKPHYYVTQSKNQEQSTASSNFKCGRIKLEDIEKIIQHDFGITPSQEMSSRLIANVCGPPEMIQYVNEQLGKLYVTNIKYEQWW